MNCCGSSIPNENDVSGAAAGLSPSNRTVGIPHFLPSQSCNAASIAATVAN